MSALDIIASMIILFNITQDASRFNKKVLINAAEGDGKSNKKAKDIGKPSLQQILSELKEMKDADIISEEEYKKLREKLIDNYEF